MSLDKLKTDMVVAMKAKDTIRKNVLRSVKSLAESEAKKDGNRDMTDADILTAVTRGIKQRKDSAAEYDELKKSENANVELLTERANIERTEIAILEDFLPTQLSEDEINALVDEALTATGATTNKERGKIMGFLSKKIVKGTVDMKLVSAIVGSKLN